VVQWQLVRVCDCSEIVINLAITDDNLLLECCDVPTLTLQIVELSQLLLLLLVKLIQVWMH